MMNGQQPQSYDGNLSVTITMSLASWQQLMQVLIEAAMPWKVVNPLVVQIERQVQAFLDHAPTVGNQPTHGRLPSGDLGE